MRRRGSREWNSGEGELDENLEWVRLAMEFGKGGGRLDDRRMVVSSGHGEVERREIRLAWALISVGRG